MAYNLVATYDKIKSAIGSATTDKDIKQLAEVVARSTMLTWDEKTRLREMLNQKNPVSGDHIFIENFYVKTSDEIPGAINRIVDALVAYAEKVKQKRMYYSASEQKWYSFDEEDKDKVMGEIEHIVAKIQRLTRVFVKHEDEPPTDPTTFNKYVCFGLKNMIMGGIEG